MNFQKTSALVKSDKGILLNLVRGQILLYAIVVIALALLSEGATAGDSSQTKREQAVVDALRWLQTQQSDTGHIGGTGASCEASWVVALAGEDPGGETWRRGGKSLLDACAEDVPLYLRSRDAGRMGKVLRAVVAAGGDSSDFGGLDLVAAIEDQYNPDTGFYHSFGLFRHLLAVLALQEAGAALPAGLASSMIAQQRPDGSWSWRIDDTPGDGQPPTGDVDTTGRILQTLAALNVDPNHPAMAAGARYLLGARNEDGGWGLDGITDANATALAVEGILAVGWNPEASSMQAGDQTPVDILLSLQDVDGGFRWSEQNEGVRLQATFDVVPALLHGYPNDIPKPLGSYLPVFIHLRSY